MDERRSVPRVRTLLGAKIVFNAGRSVIDCIVRNASEAGACVDVASPLGIPAEFDLIIAGETRPRHCRMVWQSGSRLGLSYEAGRAERPNAAPAPPPASDRNSDLVRGEMLALRAALDEMQLGIVLLDSELRAQFINRAFRKMWKLPDAKADSKPAFVALMYHGRDTKAYDIPPSKLDAYVAERVALIRAGHPSPLDLRLSNGQVVRLQCTVLPNGGRMLSYTYVTDIVRHSDELEALHAALDKVQQGVALLDGDLNVQFMNRAARRLWGVSDEQADRHPPYAELVGDARKTGAYGVSPETLESFIASRVALVRAGDPTPRDLRTGDGRHIRSQCAVLPNGGRMLTYTDVSDLVREAENLTRLAAADSLTGLHNRRNFMTRAEAEWVRFQRYQRPLTMLMVDIDHFKAINDCFGHAAGDEALKQVAAMCRDGQRGSDVVARIGGEEFVLLLPETDLHQAVVVAERIRSTVAAFPFAAGGQSVPMTVSIGVAAASLSMSGIEALLKAADQALYQAKSRGRNRVALFSPVPPGSKLAAE